MAYFTRFRKAATAVASVGTTVEVSEMETLAKGTMIIGDGSGAPTSLAVGDDDQVLTADDGEGSGVKWAASTAATADLATSFTTSANNTANETVYPVFVDGATGTQGAETDTGLTYNPSTGQVTALKVEGTTSVQTALIEYTDGDNSMTINDGGKVSFAAGFAVGSDASGDVLYHNGTTYVRLAKGDDDEVLTLASGVPSWAAGGGGGARTDFTQDDLASYQIPITAFRKKARMDVVLDNSPSAPDLGTIDNTFATAAPTLETNNQQTNGGETTHNARFQFPVPIEYVNGQTVTIRISAGMRSGTADTSASLDVVCVRTAAANTDICATAAQSINNTTAADKDFTITPTNVVSGDILDVVVSTTIQDMSASSAIYGQIKSVEVLLDVKG